MTNRRATTTTSFAALAMTLVLLGASSSRAAEYVVSKGSQVKFTAKITASSFVATTQAVRGTVELTNGASELQRATLVVAADSFTTGMSLRDAHMRDKYLEAATFPEVRFETANAAKPNERGVAEVVGDFIVKGVRKGDKLTVTAMNEGTKLRVTARTKLDITAFGIPQPKFAVVKMDPVLDVEIELVLEPKPTAP